MEIIDTHHHFWNYSRDAYSWIPEAWTALQRDHLPKDLEREAAAAGVTGVVSVQARTSEVETGWLLDFADSHPLILGVVGWVPMTGDAWQPALERWHGRRKLSGFRYVLQGMTDTTFVDRPDFNACVAELGRRGWSYDILITERQLPESIRLVDRHPEVRFILDHCAKPLVRDRILEPWASNMRELARRPNVACKLSGVVTEADVTAWDRAQVQTYLEITLAAFGPQRVMFGTDWPVCLAGVSYAGWLAEVRHALRNLSAAEQAAVLAGNARHWYRLGE